MRPWLTTTVGIIVSMTAPQLTFTEWQRNEPDIEAQGFRLPKEPWEVRQKGGGIGDTAAPIEEQVLERSPRG